ncbi:hypothetical protein HDV05_002640 [Chytridiales sp. JEL 0842]|nr:hypothetical protein HDV05_002640 [Chytridiales sp. JEL 0842]
MTTNPDQRHPPPPEVDSVKAAEAFLAFQYPSKSPVRDASKEINAAGNTNTPPFVSSAQDSVEYLPDTSIDNKDDADAQDGVGLEGPTTPPDDQDPIPKGLEGEKELEMYESGAFTDLGDQEDTIGGDDNEGEEEKDGSDRQKRHNTDAQSTLLERFQKRLKSHRQPTLPSGPSSSFATQINSEASEDPERSIPAFRERDEVDWDVGIYRNEHKREFQEEAGWDDGDADGRYGEKPDDDE